ncbi:MAG: MerR family transcriptional regulator [Humidesulfovibrio sp.]|uniref:MerR family transcriptional regulator n=1 Tax=Humidesulfovibrio sp. TaxID=2910988 RepID=UPI0027368D54|nr:MerR family transcriptional regulator [Humidesulfovibrio sp.]MDP2848841.1 MerR family transcriptional regulator [Humidesulfovibrio sp.]
MDAQSYTHRDLSKALGVSETTIKSYRSKFPTFLPVAREGKPVRLHPESLSVCLRIRDLFADGLSIQQTTQRLKLEFKEYPHNRRLSITSNPRRQGGAQESRGEGDQELANRIETLAKAQDLARQRMEQLEAEVRNLSTLEAASKALIAELLGELRSARTSPAPAAAPTAAVAPPSHVSAPKDSPEPEEKPADAPAPGSVETVLTARKIVTVHGPAGPLASYALGREPKPEPHFAEPCAPDPAFLDLPAVIRSDRGDFLGLPGGQSVRRLVDVLSPEGAAPASWFQESPDSWTCAIPLGRAQNREMLFERTTTPRGNLVGLIRRMRINEAEATPMQLQEIFRQLRDQLA